MELKYPSPVTNLQAASAVPQLLRGSVTFVAGTTGAVAQHTVFTITGMVWFGLNVRCTEDLTSGGAATLSLGNAGSVAALLGATLATTIDVGDFTTGSTDGDLATNVNAFTMATYQMALYSNGTDITADIAAFTITGGTLEYMLFWTPISVGATVALGAELTAL